MPQSLFNCVQVGSVKEDGLGVVGEIWSGETQTNGDQWTWDCYELVFGGEMKDSPKPVSGVMEGGVVGEVRRERSSVASALGKRGGNANPDALDEMNRGRIPGDTVQRTGAAISGGSTPSTPATLKEGYGWCKGCGVNQVRLPAMLCSGCRKEAGEDL